MATLLGRATERPAPEVPFDDSQNPGPLLLLANAVGVVVLTYIASYRALNIRRAFLAYDALVPAIRARVVPRISASTRKGLLGSILAVEALLAYVYFTASKETTKLMMTVGMALLGFAMSWLGFNYLVSLRPGVSFEAGRVISSKLAIPALFRLHVSKMAERILAVAVSVLSLWAAISPNVWLVTLAAVGFSASIVNGPATFTKSVSVRGLVMVCAVIPILITVVAAALVAWSMSGFAPPAMSEPRPPREQSPWEIVVLQVYGVTSGLLSALVLRYEWSISEDSYTLLAGEHSPLIGSSKVKALSAEDANAVRVPVPHGRPSFRAPMFHTLMAFTFLTYVPAIVLSLPSAVWIRASDTYPDWVQVIAQLIVYLPPAYWSLMFFPVVMGVMLLVRGDRRALWNYAELQVVTLQEAEADTDSVHSLSVLGEARFDDALKADA